MSRPGSWKLPRRLFLGTSAAAVGLPLLEVMMPRKAAAANDAKRLLCMMIPNGIHMQAWTPAQTGADYELTPILQPLAPLKHKIHVLSGFRNDPARPEGAGDHTSGVGSFLSCVHFTKDQSKIHNGTTIDQHYGMHLGNATPTPTIRLGMDGDSGYCGDGGYSCLYSRNISWVGNTPQAKLTDPKAAFDLLFSGFEPGANAGDMEAIRQRRQSVLDSALADVESLRPKLGRSDRAKLEEYLGSVRALETRIMNQPAEPTCDVRPPGDFNGAEEKMQTLMDVMVKAFQCDQTRAISFMTGNAVSGRNHDFIGAGGNHHSISHHGGKQGNYDKLQKINIWEMEQFLYLLTAMDNSMEADGSTLLDNSMVFLSSEISDGNKHNHDNLPVLLAGSGGGVLSQTGRHSEFKDVPLSNLFLTMAQKLGIALDSYGDDSTGTVDI